MMAVAARTVVPLLMFLLLWSCGKAKDKDREDPSGTGNNDAYPTDPAEAIAVGEKKTVSSTPLKSMTLWGEWNHGVVKRYTFTITAADRYKFDTYMTTTCVGVNKAAGRVGSAIYTLRSGSDPASILATSRVGNPMQVPSYEIPGKLAVGTYIVDMMWVATSSNCNVSGDFTLMVDDSSSAKVDEKFPPVRLTLGTAFSYSGDLVEDGGSGLWVPFDIKQDFRFVLTAPAAVRIDLTNYETSCVDSGYTSQFSVYDFQKSKSLHSADLVAGDKQVDLGALEMGLYEISVIKGSDAACRVGMQVKASTY